MNDNSNNIGLMAIKNIKTNLNKNFKIIGIDNNPYRSEDKLYKVFKWIGERVIEKIWYRKGKSIKNERDFEEEIMKFIINF